MQAITAPTQVSPKRLAEEILAFWHSFMKESSGNLYAVLDEFDLSITQVKTLHALNACADEVSVKDLAERLSLSLPGASRTVDGLLRRGLLERREDENDRRMKRVGLTAAGRDAVERIDNARLQGLEQFATSLTDDQRSQLYSVLAALPHRSLPDDKDPA
jgi:DNA-binding MarR family transcriptional regulator